MTVPKRHICLWILPASPGLRLREPAQVLNNRIRFRRSAKLTPSYGRRVTWTCADGGDEGSGKRENDKNDANRDWDSSWNEFNAKRQGGVFGLTEENTPQQRQKVDERTERLTEAWSNDAGFLVGIGVIALIAALYVYVYAKGGIS